MDGMLKLEIGDLVIKLPVVVQYEHQPAYNGGRTEPSHAECCVVTDLDVLREDQRRAPRTELVKQAEALQRISDGLWDYIRAEPSLSWRLDAACLDDHRATTEDRRLASTGI